MFSGLMWTGSQSIAMGLARRYGTVDSVARDVIKVKRSLDYSIRKTSPSVLPSGLGLRLVSRCDKLFSGGDGAVIRDFHDSVRGQAMAFKTILV